MPESVLRLRVDNKEFDDNIKQATAGVRAMIAQMRQNGEEIKRVSKDEERFIASLGKMETSSTTARGRLKELQKALKDLTYEYQQLSDEERKGEIGEGLAKSMQNLKPRIEEAKREVADLGNKMKGTGGIVTDFASKLGISTKALTTWGAAIAAGKLAIDAIKSNIDMAKDFEYSVSKLSSLTGMVGDDLETLKGKAIELGSVTTQSASQAAEAMAVIGSKRPDLLSSAYALGDVTKAAITMSEAAGMDVPAAADALAAALNIFQMESSEATRIINVLAAGSKLGAAGIEELGKITFRAGGMAKKAGLSFEEFAGAAEIIRPAFGSAEDAGIAFNKFLMKLESKMKDEYRPSVVGFSQAIKNLRDSHMDANEALKVFTVNGVKAYDAIMANVDGLDKMIAGVTGTNTAEEQASKNTDNLRGSINKLSSAWEGFNLSINDSNGALKSMVDWLTDCVSWATKTFTELGRIKAKMDEINGVTGGGSSSRISKEVAEVRGSNYKTDAQRGIGGRYDKEIEAYQKRIDKMKADIDIAVKNGAGQSVMSMRKQIQEWEEEITALKNLKKEFYARSNEIINGKKKTSGNTTNTGVADEDDGNETNNLLRQIAKGKSPQEKAADRVASAQLDYAQTIEKADIRMQAGLDDTLAHKKKELSAEERLFDAYSDAYAMFKNPAYKDALNKSAERLGQLAEEVKATSDANEEEKKAAQALAAAAKKKASELEKRQALEESWQTPSTGAFDSKIKDLKAEISTLDVTSEAFDSLRAQLVDSQTLSNLFNEAIKHGISTADWDIPGLWDKILKGENIADVDWQAIEAQINEALQQLNIKPIKLDVQTGNIEKVKKDGDAVADNMKDAANAIQQVGSALSQIEDPAAKVAGLVAMAIANIAATFAKSLDKTFSPWDWIAAAASGTATMISTIAAIKSATAEHHAMGGFVKGKPGDNNLFPIEGGGIAALSPGELVLNQAQQQAVGAALSSGARRDDQVGIGVRVQGDMMFTCLDNYMKMSNKRFPTS